MGNSATTLQSVVDYASTIPDLNPVLASGGFATSLAIAIANDVMSEMLSQRFNFKFNRIIVPQFVTNSNQQDYPTVNLQTVGWLEHAVAIDINNTQVPKPIFWLEAVRDLEMTSFMFGRPCRVCWLPNDQLVIGTWPGAQVTYTNPVGAAITPSNGPIAITDAHGNILVLTTYGKTGNTAPDAGVTPAVGATVTDGTVVWTVANPKAQGFRLSPLPPQTGVAYQMYIIAQARPTKFTSLDQMLDPIPDDYARHFSDGFIAYSHRHSGVPVVRQRFAQMRSEWLQSLMEARGVADRERDAAGIVPETSIMDSSIGINIGPAWPFGPF